MLPTCASHSFLPGPQVWPSQIEPQSPGLLERAAITLAVKQVAEPVLRYVQEGLQHALFRASFDDRELLPALV